MTRALTILGISIFASATAMAQSRLRVRTADNAPITISVDGRYFNRRGTAITVGDLPAGMHTLRIFQIIESKRGRASQEEVYNGRVRTDAGMITNFTSDTYGGSTSIQQMPLGDNSTPGYTTNNQVTHINNEPRSDDRRNNGTSDRNDITPAVADDAAPVDNGKPVASPDIIDEGTMTEPKTNKLKTRVTAKSTDTERLKTIKEALKGEKVSTYQVSVMMDWFSFENSKLDFAKWAYDITMDKDHYSDLVAKFTYKDSEEDLRKFLQSK